jgi:hypothetical protein
LIKQKKDKTVKRNKNSNINQKTKRQEVQPTDKNKKLKPFMM